jgi:hypothetical protein
MATRMQQRRGTAAQWISTNAGAGPILNAGEIGWESDTNKFKIGDGVNNWSSLDYFADINSTVNPAFGTSITFEGATADSFETIIQVTDPTADRTITFPDASGTVALTTDIAAGLVTETGTQTLTNKTLTSPILTTPNIGAATGTSLVLSGDLTVNGITTTINSSTLSVDDKNIALGSIVNAIVSSTGTVGTVSGTGPYTSTITNMVSTTGLLPGAVITATNGTGDFGSGTVKVVTIPSTTSITVSSDLAFNAGTVTNITATGPTDTSADGGGITVKGSTDKTFNWVDATDSWTSSEHINLASGKSYSMNGTALKDVSETLTNKTLTSPIISSISNTGTLTLPTSTDTLVGRATTDTLTNKSISLTTNTVTGTIAEFNSAVTDQDLATLAGTETLTNKTLSSAVATTALTLNARAEIRLADTDSSHYVGFKSPATVTSNIIWTLPATDGLVGQSLATDGSGNLVFAAGGVEEALIIMGAL